MVTLWMILGFMNIGLAIFNFQMDSLMNMLTGVGVLTVAGFNFSIVIDDVLKEIKNMNVIEREN